MHLIEEMRSPLLTISILISSLLLSGQHSYADDPVNCTATAVENIQVNELAMQIAPVFSALSLREFSKEMNAKLDELTPTSLQPEEAQDLWNHIKLWSKTKWMHRLDLLEPRLEGVFHHLLANKKIRYLTSEAKEELKLKEFLCKIEAETNTEQCKKMLGFYLPLTNTIYIEKTLSKEGQARALFHEVFHAYQYSYRYPFDLAELDKLRKEGKIKSEDVRDTLNFYYESQANYQTDHYQSEEIWEKVYRSNLETAAYAVTGLAPLLALGAPYGAFAGVVSYGGMMASNAITNSYLPEVGKIPILAGNILPPERAALGPPELIILDDAHTPFHLTVNYDFYWHKKKAKAVEREYFGKLLFLFQKNRNDLDVHNRLHNNYYDRLGAKEKVEFEDACKSLLEKVQSSKLSPMVEWLTLEQSEIEACGIYKGSGHPSYRKEAEENIMQSGDSKSIFNFIRPAGEGTRPGYKLAPSIQVLPQLEVKPYEF